MFVLFVAILVQKCTTKAVPDERIAIDPNFLTLFNSLIQKDTVQFSNSHGVNKTFVITKVDSIINNQKALFLNVTPYRLLRVNF